MIFRLLIIAVFFAPAVSNAQVLFSEIAWMGTVEDANNEWIEIYNFDSSPTDLTGWTLSDGNSLHIELSGTMQPHGVFLLERTDDDTVPGISASIIYTGALTNGGATLTIKDSGGSVVSELVGGTGWANIGGDNEYKYTAQSTRTGQWVTAEPTPGMPNAEEDVDIPVDDTTDSPRGGGGPATHHERQHDSEVNTDLAITVMAPSVTYVDQAVHFDVATENVGRTTAGSLKYFWNFGDLSTAAQKKAVHTFGMPGKYTVAVEAAYKSQSDQARHEIEVIPVALRLSQTDRGDVLITNEASEEVDLEGYMITGIGSMTLPRLTIVKAGGTLRIPREKLNGRPSSFALYDTQKKLIASSAVAPTESVLGRVGAAPKTISAKTVSKQKVSQAAAESKELDAKPAQPQVIKIGNEISASDSNLFARFFKRLGSMFRL